MVPFRISTRRDCEDYLVKTIVLQMKPLKPREEWLAESPNLVSGRANLRI